MMGENFMCDKKDNVQPDKWSPITEKNTRHDGMMRYGRFDGSHVNETIESSGTKPIDISLMTGNKDKKEANKK
jgi:hypothetical protein